MDINIENCQKIIQLDVEFNNYILKLVEYVLNFEEVNIECEISIFFVDNNEIRKINFEHRGLDKETDCLSFPMLSYEKDMVFKNQYKNFKFKDYELNQGKLLLGDIIISLEKAQSQSLEFGHQFVREVSYLIIHSLLHLLGYDHIESRDRQTMRSMEKEIIRNLGIFR